VNGAMQQSVSGSKGVRFSVASVWDSRRLLAVASAIVLIGAAACVVTSPMLAVSVVVGVLTFVVVCSEKRLKFAIFALALYTPFEEFILKWIPDDYFFYARFGHYAFLTVCFVAILLRRLAQGRPLWVRTPLDVPLFLFVVVSCISLFANGVAPFAAALSYQPFLRFVILGFYLVMFIEFDRNDAAWLTKAMLAVVFVECLIGLAQSAIGARAGSFLAPVGGEFRGHLAGQISQRIYTGHYQIFATMGRYNTFGMFLGIFLVLSIPLYERYKSARKALLALYCVLLPCLLLAAARAAWLATLAGAMVVFAVQKKAKTVTIPIAVALVIVVAMLAFPEQVSYVGTEQATSLQRFLEPFSAKYRAVASNKFGRIYYIFGFPADVFSLGPGRFLLGFGPGTLGKTAVDIFGIYTLADIGVRLDWHHFVHDVNWAYIFGQVGLIGLGCFVWGCVRLFRTISKVHRTTDDAFLRSLSLGCMGVFVIVVIAAFFYPAWEVRPLSLYFWLYAGIVLKLGAAERLERARRNEEGLSGGGSRDA